MKLNPNSKESANEALRTAISTLPAKVLGYENINFDEYISNLEASEIINRNFRSLRLICGYKAVEIAEAFGVHRVIISNRETKGIANRIQITYPYLSFLCYNVKIDKESRFGPQPILFRQIENIKDDEKTSILWVLALKALDKAFKVNSTLDIDKELTFLTKLRSIDDLEFVKEICSRIAKNF